MDFYKLAAGMGMLNSQRPDSERTLPSPGSTAYESMSDEQKAAVDAERVRRTNSANYNSQFEAGRHSYGGDIMDVFRNPNDYTEGQRRNAALHGMALNEANGMDIWAEDTNRWATFGNVTPEEYELYKQQQADYGNTYDNPYASTDVRWSSGFEGGRDFGRTPGQSNWGNSGGSFTFGGSSSVGGAGGGSNSNHDTTGGQHGTGYGPPNGGSAGGSAGGSTGEFQTQVSSSTPFMDAYLRSRESAKAAGPVSGMFKDELNK